MIRPARCAYFSTPGACAAPLEAPHRIERLDLEGDRTAQHVTEWGALELWRIEEHRID